MSSENARAPFFGLRVKQNNRHIQKLEEAERNNELIQEDDIWLRASVRAMDPTSTP